MTTAATEFTEWFVPQLRRSGLGMRQFAIKAGVSATAVQAWTRGARPSWESCGAIASALRVDPGMVRRLAGYGDEAAGAAVTAATPQLNHQEETLLDAFRSADEAGRRALLATAEAVTRTESERASEDQPGSSRSQRQEGRAPQ